MIPVLNTLGILLEVLILFNFIILVHELGHFLAARWRGLKVEKFQIWFGRPIWSKTVNGVRYGLGWIPAGGFVALPQMLPMEMLEGRSESGEESLPPAKPMDRIIVAFAGPLFSFGLAAVFAVLVWAVGHPVPVSQKTTTIGFVDPEGAEGVEQLRAGDVIRRVDNRPVERWHGMIDSVTWNIVSSQDDTIRFEVDRPGEGLRSFEVKPDRPSEGAAKQSWLDRFFSRSQLRQVGIGPKFEPMVGKVLPGSPAERAGIRPSDIVAQIDGEDIIHPAQVAEKVRQSEGRPLQFTVWRPLRGGRDREVREFTITPQRPLKREESGPDPPLMIGTVWDETGLTVLEHPGPVRQIRQSVQTMVSTLGAVFSPRSEIGLQHLSGPVMIMRVYYLFFEDKDGWRRALWFSVVLNINLAILNLLPFPVLDGGHIAMSFLEMVRRKPINVRVLEVVQLGCVVLLIAFMLHVTRFDLGDIFRSGGAEQEMPVFEWQRNPGGEGGAGEAATE
ncbi:MAG TPA: RIP metalloprotease RseP [Verrucomicrobiales bacterium]|nr:RIP metalloprotease RseP [Verrucomicrobiales bacterium]